MGAGPCGYTSEHDASDRTFFAVLLIVVGLLGTGVALAHRQTMSPASAPGDACPTSAHGGLVGLDADTGTVRWTNVVPDGGNLRLDEKAGDVHLIRLAQDGQTPGDTLIVDRVVDPSTGSITACSTERDHLTVQQYNALLGFASALEPPIEIGDATVMKWGYGVRATDAASTGIWGIERATAAQRIGDDLLVDVFDGDDTPSRTVRVDLRTGKERWSVEGRLTNEGADVEVNTIVTSSWNRLGAVSGSDPVTGKTLWTTEVPFVSSEVGNGVIDSFDLGTLVLVPIGEEGRVAALDATTGQVLWTTEAGAPGRSRKYSRPGSAHDAVLSPDGDTVIVAVDAWQPEQD